MTPRSLASWLPPALALTSLLLTAGLSTAAAPTPNLVLILADDLGWGDPATFNPDSKIPTPHLDRLTTEGMRFTDAHTPSSVCSPTRYALLTGRYAWRSRLQTGVLWGYSPPLIPPSRLTLASLLQNQGYQTAAIGKWHLGLEYPTQVPTAFGDGSQPAADPALIDYTRRFPAGPLTVGFDDCFTIPASLDMDPYFFLENDRAVLAPTLTVGPSQPRRNGGGGYWRGGPTAPGFSHENCLPRLTQAALSFLRRQSPDHPFFLYFPLTAPHTPWMPTETFRGRSGIGPYGDFVMQVDDAVGQVMSVLDDRGFTENTLFIFTSDNGSHWLPADIQKSGHHANGPWRGMKADLFEGGHRVPFLVRWPGHVRPGSQTDALIGLQDVLATVADLLHVDLPKSAAEDSLSFLRVLNGARRGQRRHQVHHSINGSFALRQGPWKLLFAPDSGGWSPPRPGSTEARDLPPAQLYHLERDPAETTNLAEENPRVVQRLTRTLEKLIADGRTRPGAPAANDADVVLWKGKKLP